MKPRMRRLGDLFPAILKAVGPRVRAEFEELAAAWERAVGSDVARRTRVLGFQRDTLTVAVESAPMRQEIELFRKPDLLARMRQEFPGRKIADLKCILRALESP